MITLPSRTIHAAQSVFGVWNPTVVMFDLDGTLIDTMGGFADLAAALIQEHYAVEMKIARKRYLGTSGIPFRQQLEVIFPEDPRNEPVAEMYERRKPAICLHAKMDTDTIWMLKLLQSWSIKIVVSSNSAQHFVDDFHQKAPITFDMALGFGAGLAKGASHVEQVIQQFDVSPKQMLFVGDSLKDGELAFDCGQRFIGRTGTFKRHQFTARFSDIPTIDHISDLRFMVAPCR